MKISHELPMSLLPLSSEINDYEYCLAHLIIEYLEGNTKLADYHNNYFGTERMCYLDNSAFELGQSVDPAKLALCIMYLLPSHYFIPDKCNSVKKSVKMFDDWMSSYGKMIKQMYPNMKRIQALQGRNLDEILEHCTHIYGQVDLVGVSYDYTFFDKTPDGRCEDRIWLVGEIIKQFPGIQIHLLGCQSPYEFTLFPGYPSNVVSVDTSHPVMTALDGKMYSHSSADLLYKSPNKLADNINARLDDNQLSRLEHNIHYFRATVNSRGA